MIPFEACGVPNCEEGATFFANSPLTGPCAALPSQQLSPSMQGFTPFSSGFYLCPTFQGHGFVHPDTVCAFAPRQGVPTLSPFVSEYAFMVPGCLNADGCAFVLYPVWVPRAGPVLPLFPTSVPRVSLIPVVGDHFFQESGGDGGWC